MPIAILTQKIEGKKNFGRDRENKGPFITSEQSHFWRSFFFFYFFSSLYNKKDFVPTFETYLRPLFRVMIVLMLGCHIRFQNCVTIFKERKQGLNSW